MSRKENWPQLLNQYLGEIRSKEFEWGVFDCCIMCAGAIEAITGEDLMSEFRGKYDSEETSDEALAEIGKGDLYQTLVDKLGEPVDGAHGQRGDVAYHEPTGICGIVYGKKAMFIGDEGFVVLPMIHSGIKAFKVG